MILYTSISMLLSVVSDAMNAFGNLTEGRGDTEWEFHVDEVTTDADWRISEKDEIVWT